MKKVLVYGFYFHENLGDDLFMEAFQYLFPDIEFIFTDYIDTKNLNDIDVIFFGGGSFLLEKPIISNEAFEELKYKKIFYLGIGVEAEMHPAHKELMSNAVMVGTRSQDQVNNLKLINKNVAYFPDLIYSLQSKVEVSPKSNRSVLIMPNISVVPSWSSPHWKHAAWSYFKSEFAQFLDWVIINDYKINLFPMCRGNEMDDGLVSAELVLHMNNRNYCHIYSGRRLTNVKDITSLISQHDLVITQRFHGIVLANMTKIPCFSISHHDKIKSEHTMSYYGLSKDKLIRQFQSTVESKVMDTINPATFMTFSKQVIDLL